MARDKRNEKRGGKFVRYDYKLLDAPSWRSLSGNAIKLHLTLIRRAFGSADGLAALSEREACEVLGISSRDTIRRAFGALEEAGFIALEVPAQLGVNGHGRAAKWRLTHLPYAGKAPSREFAKNAESLPKNRAMPLPKNQAMGDEENPEPMAQKLGHTGKPPLPKNRSISKTLPWACDLTNSDAPADPAPGAILADWPRHTFDAPPPKGEFLENPRTFSAHSRARLR